MVDEQTQENFITCLSSLQLLAKILGLVVSLPYRSESNNFKELVATQVEVRSKVSNVLNITDLNEKVMSLTSVFNIILFI